MDTSDPVALRAELDKLNMQCQLARDNEVRYALQRSRLEAERVKLLVSLYDAAPRVASSPAAPAVAVPTTVTPESTPDAKPAVPSVVKPQGLPTVPEMILQILTGVGDGLRPIQITNQIRREWWPEMPADRVLTTAFRMAQEGRLAKDGTRYKLNGHGAP